MLERVECKSAVEVVAESSPTVVVFEITTVFTEVSDAPVEFALEPEVVGCSGERRLSVVPAEDVSLSVPVIPPKIFDNERGVEDKEEDSEEVSLGVKLVIVEFT